MKKTLLLISLIFIFTNCNDDAAEYRKRCDIITPQTIYLNNPQFINLTNPGGHALAQGGPRGIVIYYSGINYTAISLECPSSTQCNEPMRVDGLKLVCPCDESEYSILDGSPITEGVTTPACVFKVTGGNSVLNISNL